MQPYFDAITTIWKTRSYKIAEYIVFGLYPTPLVSQELADATKAWLEANPDIPALRRLVTENLAGVERALLAQAKDAELRSLIEAIALTKRFGDKPAVDGIDFQVQPGRVTGFLGPNGAGKSTTMRMIVGLDRPTSGTVTINGQRYADLKAPLHEVGVLLDAKAVHTGRSAYNHLLALGATHGIGKKRVNEVIALTGLESVARKRVGGFSLGMGQRLGIASALLGDPGILILDEPVNGLDPEGVIWVRTLARHMAAEGRTVFLSSHLMSEMAQTADQIIVLGRGKVIADAPVERHHRAGRGQLGACAHPRRRPFRHVARRQRRHDHQDRPRPARDQRAEGRAHR